LDQASDGEKLMVGMGISMALNPTMRILRIKDGSLLGPANLKILSDMVKDKGYQLWLERVSGRDEYEAKGKVGVFIEEGEVEGLEVQKVEKKKSKPSPVGINHVDEENKTITRTAKIPTEDEDW
jgi:hypothetical protein